MAPVPPVTGTFSVPTLLMLRELLANTSVPATHPKLVEAAEQIATGLRELDAALNAGDPPADG